jgi:alpha-L-arabinofuranosidase
MKKKSWLTSIARLLISMSLSAQSAIMIIYLIFALPLAARQPDDIQIFKVSKQEIASTPVSLLLYGNFIELGYGIQVESMWSEMFFNRSFEKFMPYRDINKLWYDVVYDEKDLSKGYERDWSKFDWYHSGYEHNSWFAAPGTPPKASWIDDSSTFITTTTPLRKVVVNVTKGGSGHGEQCLQVTNREEKEWAAVAQEGKLLKMGETYMFRGMMKTVSGAKEAEIRLYPQGKWDTPVFSFPVKNLTNNFSEQSFTFTNTDFEGYATFSLWIPGRSSVLIDDFSMKPSSSYYGWRKEAVDVFRQLGPKVVRFPGGCFASFYDWKDGIGPYSKRIPQDSYFWGGQNYNDVGIAEYATLCKASGAEMSYCVNVYHPSKRRYDVDFPTWQADMGREFTKFMSLTDGAKSAAELVAYCNLPAGEHLMADLRVKHGYPEPFGVKYWELDNEVARWFEAEDYAWAVVVYSKAMKAVDPSIQIGLSSYGDRPGRPTYHDDIDKMLEIAGQYIDFLADRGDADKVSAYMLGKVRAYNKAYGTDIKYCDTEWLAYNTEQNRDAYNLAQKEGGITKSYAFSKWYYGLNLLKNFMAFQRLGDDILFVNFNNLANTHSQSAMETPKEGAYLTASGRALELLSNSSAAWLLKFENYTAKANDDYQVQAAWDLNREKLVLYVCNRTASARRAIFDLASLGMKFSKATASKLQADSPVAMNTLSNPQAIKKTITEKKIRLKNDNYTIEAPAYSFIEIVLE